MVLVEKWPFCLFIYFYAIQARKMSFKTFQNEKAPSYAIKTKSSKIRKIDIFPRGLTLDMGQKWPGFFFFLGNIGQKNVFYNILEREKAFLRYKKKKFKTRKIDIFPKWLTHGFGPKMAIFPTFFFRQYRPGKCPLRNSRTKKCLSRL